MQLEYIHKLKIETQYLDLIKSGVKTFEIRKNDRSYKVDDLLILTGFENGSWTSERVYVRVVYITDYEQKEGYIVLGIEKEEEVSEILDLVLFNE
jgi:ASC-1-like (ASCH) protein